jgi:hypothetical protein
MARDYLVGEPITPSIINQITPDDGEIIVGGPDAPIRMAVSDFANAYVPDEVIVSETEPVGVPDGTIWVQPFGTPSGVVDLDAVAEAAVAASPTIATHTASIARIRDREIHARDYGVVADGVTDQRANIMTMLADADTKKIQRIVFPTGDIIISATIPITRRGYRFIGERGDRTATHGGTSLLFTGTGPLFELGSDKGESWDEPDYDGVGTFNLEHLRISAYGGGMVALSNGRGNYKPNTYGIRDWRGGDIELIDVLFEQLDYNFWGVQSDISQWYKVQSRYSHRGFYLGPRCDQFTVYSYMGFYNDTSWEVDGAFQVRFINSVFVADGSPTYAPINLHCEWTRTTENVIFDNCWFEDYPATADSVNAWIDVGVGSLQSVNHVIIRNPTIIASGTVRSFVRVENGTTVTIENANGSSIGTLDNLVECIGATNPRIRIIDHDVSFVPSKNTVLNSGTGTPKVHKHIWGSGYQKFGSTAFTWIGEDGSLGAGISPTSRLESSGSFATKVSYVAANTTLSAAHHTVGVDSTAGAVTITLPTATGIAGRQYIIKRSSGANTVTVATTGGQTINLAATKTLGAVHSAITVVSFGSAWEITGQVGTVT